VGGVWERTAWLFAADVPGVGVRVQVSGLIARSIELARQTSHAVLSSQVIAMRLPGFTADVSLYKSRGYQQRTANRSGKVGGREIVSQLTGRQFGGVGFGGGLFGFGDYYWACRNGCDRAYKDCLDTCEGTWASPKGSSNCILCDDDHRTCLQGCTKDIA
jgi:hypothetical protein